LFLSVHQTGISKTLAFFFLKEDFEEVTSLSNDKEQSIKNEGSSLQNITSIEQQGEHGLKMCMNEGND